MLGFFTMYIKARIFNEKNKITLLAVFFSIAITGIYIASSMLAQVSDTVNSDSEHLRTVTALTEQHTKTQDENYKELCGIKDVEKVTVTETGQFEIVFKKYNAVKAGIDSLRKSEYTVRVNIENQMHLETTQALTTTMQIAIIFTVIIIFIILLIFIIKIINDRISEIALLKAIGYKNIYVNIIISCDFIIAFLFSMLLCVPICWVSEAHLIPFAVSNFYNSTTLNFANSFDLGNYLLILYSILILLCIAILLQSRKISNIPTTVLLKE